MVKNILFKGTKCRLDKIKGIIIINNEMDELNNEVQQLLKQLKEPDLNVAEN